MKKSLFILSTFFISIVIISGCKRNFEIHVDEIGYYPKPLVKSLPLTVGVYYGNDFSTFKAVQTINITVAEITYIDYIEIGKANIVLFDYMLSNVFEKVTPLKSLSTDSGPINDVDLIIEPNVTAYAYEMDSFDYSVHVRLSYEIRFYLPDGKQIGSWYIGGYAHKDPKIEFKREPTAVRELTQTAMREAATEFITGICNQEEINKILNNECTQ
jgi:hypothetical protein